MRVINDIHTPLNLKNAVVTIGTFDGVHLGHQAIFKEMRRRADELGGETVVVTFYPHPRQVLEIETQTLRFICSQEEKLQKFEDYGIDDVVVIPFTKAFAATPSEVFVKDYIIDKLHPAVIMVGYDHHFGKDRQGDFQMLDALSKTYGFRTVQVEAQYVNGIAVSSTKIRKALWDGDVKAANQMLGYPYSVSGTVVKGNQIGRTIGFPTANLDLADEFMMINNPGVYACQTVIEGKTYNAMANTGFRPTVRALVKNGKLKTENGKLRIEVNIFDFDGDLYGKTLKVAFIDRIRDEVKFEGLDALKEQLHQDREEAKKRIIL